MEHIQLSQLEQGWEIKKLTFVGWSEEKFFR